MITEFYQCAQTSLHCDLHRLSHTKRLVKQVCSVRVRKISFLRQYAKVDIQLSHRPAQPVMCLRIICFVDSLILTGEWKLLYVLLYRAHVISSLE